MLANNELMAASAAARRTRIAAVLATDSRVRFARLAGGLRESGTVQPGRPCVAVFVDPSADAKEAGSELAALLAADAGTAGLDVAVLNTMDLDHAGLVLSGGELLLDRDRAARIEFEVRASGAHFDFRESGRVFLRERAERPYADVVTGKLAMLDEYIRRLREYEGLATEEYAADWKAQCVVERTLEVAIGLCIGVMRHALAERGLREPSTYRETFAIARDAGLVEPGLAASLMRMCGFRNVLAHEGTDVDAAVVAGILRTGVADFVRFRDAASRL